MHAFDRQTDRILIARLRLHSMQRCKDRTIWTYVWNSLPAECTNFSSLNSFRLSLFNVDFSKFLIID